MTRVLLLLAAAMLSAPAQAMTVHSTWTSAFAASPSGLVPAEMRLGGRTIRQFARVSASGTRLRLRLTNVAGAQPLTVGRVVAGGVAVTFNGRDRAMIAPGALLFSDPVRRQVRLGERIEVRLYLPDADARPTTHEYGFDTAHISTPGDFTRAATIPVATSTTQRILLAGIDVETGGGSTIVAVGDSITDGGGATVDADARWPDVLSRRLAAAGRNVAVVNAGIGGNKLLRDGSAIGIGRALLARFDTDVLALDGVRAIIVLIGINDLGWPAARTDTGVLAPASDLPSVEAIMDGYCQIALRAHARGIRAIGATLTPFANTNMAPGYATPAKDAMRRAINARLRAGACYDAMIDFDRALADPAHPDQMLPAFDSGDHLHPSDAGNAAMGSAIDLKLVP